MCGLTATIRARVPELRLHRAVLGSIRVIREFNRTGELPPGVRHTVGGMDDVLLERRLLDGRRLRVRIAAEGGSGVRVEEAGRVSLLADDGGDITSRIAVLTEAPPLTPIPKDQLLRADLTTDDRDLQALAFLSYREKLLAGSWRFLTYFGRDTLLTVRLLMPVLRPEVIEAGLGSVIARLAPDGRVAHEEDIGDYASLRRKAEDLPGDPGTPIHDHRMVDDDFLLAPVLAHYLLDTPEGRSRARDFLAPRQRQVLANLGYVLRRTAPYAERPEAGELIAIRRGEQVGEWRDSLDGLGGGRIPYNVNAALVPAALQAAARLYASGLLGDRDAQAARARAMAETWRSASAHFLVEVPADEAADRLRAYAGEAGIEATVPGGPVVFPALALRADHRPVEVMHSDDGFVLLFLSPGPGELERIADLVLEPFPLGLRTPVGMLVSNPAFCPDPAERARFSRRHYHGTVVWSWQQALMAAGLRRQLARTDLPAGTREKLRRAEGALWDVIRATGDLRRSELWSWEVVDGAYRPVPFGQGRGHHTESNAVQLWSTVYLGVRPPEGP
jgi:glycogen debranching enzyme